MKYLIVFAFLAGGAYFGYKQLQPHLPPDDVLNRQHYFDFIIANRGMPNRYMAPDIGKWYEAEHREGYPTRALVVPYRYRIVKYEVKRQHGQNQDIKGRSVKAYPVDILMHVERDYDLANVKSVVPNLGKVVKADPNDYKDLAEKVRKAIPLSETIEKRLIYFLESDGKTWSYEQRKT